MRQVVQRCSLGELQLVETAVPYQAGQGAILVRLHCSLISIGTEKPMIDVAQKILLGEARMV